VPYRSGFGGADFCRVHQALEKLPPKFPRLGLFATLFSGPWKFCHGAGARTGRSFSQNHVYKIINPEVACILCHDFVNSGLRHSLFLALPR
jgi:hypothetical protein